MTVDSRRKWYPLRIPPNLRGVLEVWESRALRPPGQQGRASPAAEAFTLRGSSSASGMIRETGRCGRFDFHAAFNTWTRPTRRPFRPLGKRTMVAVVKARHPLPISLVPLLCCCSSS